MNLSRSPVNVRIMFGINGESITKKEISSK